MYRWGVRRRIYRWYGELSYIERAVIAGQGKRDAQLQRLEEIERRINRLQVPLAFAAEAFQLRSHVQMVRSLVVAKHQGANPIPDTTS